MIVAFCEFAIRSLFSPDWRVSWVGRELVDDELLDGWMDGWYGACYRTLHDVHAGWMEFGLDLKWCLGALFQLYTSASFPSSRVAESAR